MRRIQSSTQLEERKGGELPQGERTQRTVSPKTKQRLFQKEVGSEYFKCYRDDKENELITFGKEKVMVSFKRAISVSRCRPNVKDLG